ncbi:MAG: o-succinylbenzoate synthase, partial [Rhodothermales bacterium]|nr:o-succinylbenzoate synthase [Rhodothermales bacterium]
MIIHAEVFRYVLPLATPLVLGGAPVEHREGVLLRLEGASGAAGWGDAAPLPGFSEETAAEAATALRHIGAALTGQVFSDATSPEGDLARWLSTRPMPPSVRCAVEGAVWDLAAAERGVPLPALLTPRPHATVPLNGLLVGEGEAVVASAQRMRARGYRAVKLKVGRGAVEADVARVRAVAAALGPSVALRLDANRAWSWRDAVAFAEGIAGVRVAYIEEPLADPAALPAFAGETGLPVALDESLVGMAPDRLGDPGYASAVVLKPTFLGGPVEALRWARRAAALGMEAVVSSAFESGIGLRLLAALAASLGTHRSVGTSGRSTSRGRSTKA